MNFTYRPEIDGLRALSVILVVLHHLGAPFMTGGYVGVDVFFVISGYLITKTLIADAQRGGISISQFYKRRIIRLAPAYFTVIGAVSLVALWLLLPSELMSYAKSAVSSTFFVANIHMWREAGDYFGAAAHVTPLLHLWSLAVEEQFYVFWPIFLIGLFKFLPHRNHGPVIAVLLLLGTLLSEIALAKAPAAAYFLMPTRAFELLVGALLVYLPSVNDRPGNWVLSLLGIGAIVGAAVGFSQQTPFPGMAALLPCLGAALFIRYSSAEDAGLGAVFAKSAPVLLGKLSYPAYLWHWPIIAFLNVCLIPIGWLLGSLVFFATFFLAWVTFRYVEQPATKLRELNASGVATVGFVLPTVIVTILFGLVQSSRGFPARFDRSVLSVEAAFQSHPNKIRSNCFGDNLDPSLCLLGVRKEKVDVLLVGDSFANHFSGSLDVWLTEANLRGADLTRSNALFLPGARRFYTERGVRREHLGFLARNSEISEIIGAGNYRAVVIAGYWTAFLERGEFVGGGSEPKEVFKTSLEKGLSTIIASGATPYILVGNPTLPNDLHLCSIGNVRMDMQKPCEMPRLTWDKEIAEWASYLVKLTKRYPELKLVDISRVMCDNRSCKTELDGIPLYRDPSHLNDIGARLLARKYLEQFGNPFSPLNVEAKGQ